MNWNDTVAGLIPQNLGAELQQTLLAVTGGLTLILIAGVIALIGWLLGALLSRAAQTILSLAGIDAPAKRLATGTGVRPDFLPSRMVGFAVFWLMILATSILALRVLGLDLRLRRHPITYEMVRLLSSDSRSVSFVGHVGQPRP